MSISLTINGVEKNIIAPDDTPLLWVLRDELGLTGTKFGCGVAACGACTVHLDGAPIRSCQTTIGDIGTRKITTIEGASGKVAKAVQSAWQDLNVVQCGYCQSGQIMAAIGLLTKTPKPTDEDINEAMSGNACRCATYQRIRKAVHLAAEKLEA